MHDNLTTRISLIEDRLALLDLEGRYAKLYDSRDSEAWSNLFTEDGSYEGRRLVNMPEQNFVRGRADLGQFCASEPASGIHSMHVPTFTIDGAEATGRIHFQFQGSHTDADRRQHSRSVTGYYDVLYTKQDGEWRIARRVTTYIESKLHIVYPYESTFFDLRQPAAADSSHDARR